MEALCKGALCTSYAKVILGGIARSKVLVVTRDSGRLGRSTKFYALLVQTRGR